MLYIIFAKAHLTAVTATSTGDFTVAFIGTSDGRLKKAVIESATSGIEYSDIPIAPGNGDNQMITAHLNYELYGLSKLD